MADFDPRIGTPNTRLTSPTKRPAVENAELAADLGEAGMSVFQGYALADTEDAVRREEEAVYEDLLNEEHAIDEATELRTATIFDNAQEEVAPEVREFGRTVIRMQESARRRPMNQDMIDARIQTKAKQMLKKYPQFGTEIRQMLAGGGRGKAASLSSALIMARREQEQDDAISLSQRRDAIKADLAKLDLPQHWVDSPEMLPTAMTLIREGYINLQKAKAAEQELKILESERKLNKQVVSDSMNAALPAYIEEARGQANALLRKSGVLTMTPDQAVDFFTKGKGNTFLSDLNALKERHQNAYRRAFNGSGILTEEEIAGELAAIGQPFDLIAQLADGNKTVESFKNARDLQRVAIQLHLGSSPEGRAMMMDAEGYDNLKGLNIPWDKHLSLAYKVVGGIEKALKAAHVSMNAGASQGGDLPMGPSLRSQGVTDEQIPGAVEASTLYLGTINSMLAAEKEPTPAMINSWSGRTRHLLTSLNDPAVLGSPRTWNKIAELVASKDFITNMNRVSPQERDAFMAQLQETYPVWREGLIRGMAQRVFDFPNIGLKGIGATGSQLDARLGPGFTFTEAGDLAEVPLKGDTLTVVEKEGAIDNLPENQRQAARRKLHEMRVRYEKLFRDASHWAAHAEGKHGDGAYAEAAKQNLEDFRLALKELIDGAER